MPRPPKCRRVEQFPGVTYFKPPGIPVSELTEVVLTVEEFESIRLRDLEGLEQEECAEKMAVSRPTFHRILCLASSKFPPMILSAAPFTRAKATFCWPGTG